MTSRERHAISDIGHKNGRKCVFKTTLLFSPKGILWSMRVARCTLCCLKRLVFRIEMQKSPFPSTLFCALLVVK